MKNKKNNKLKRAYSLIRKLRGFEQIIDNTDTMEGLAVLHGEILMLKFHIQQTISDDVIKACHMMYNDQNNPQDRYQDYNWIRWQTVKKYGRNSMAWGAAKKFIDILKHSNLDDIPF